MNLFFLLLMYFVTNLGINVIEKKKELDDRLKVDIPLNLIIAVVSMKLIGPIRIGTYIVTVPMIVKIFKRF